MLLAYFAILVAAAASSAPPTLPRNTRAGQLDDFIFPTAYQLEFRFETDFFNTSTFSGTTTITLKTVQAPTTLVPSTSTTTASFDAVATPKTFQFHAKNLVLGTATFKGSTEIGITLSEADPETDLVTATLDENLQYDTKYTLTIPYTGTLNDDTLVGVYSSSYIDEFNIERHVVATQFEEIHARRAFPCFDEPAFTATFKVLITYPKGSSVWTNKALGEAKEDETDPNLEMVKSANTKVMPTYLVAFVIAPVTFMCKKASPYQDVKTIQLCSRITPMDTSAKLALDSVTTFVENMITLTNVSYSTFSSTLTLVALPDFAAGAMENMGLITFKEENILWDETKHTTYAKQKVVTTLAHEVSHQWFGDIVTLKWWGDMFLKEGLATYFQYLLADQMYPDLELWKQFPVEQTQAALVADSLDNSLPLSYDVEDPDYSNRVNDVSYNKGASIFKMIEQMIGLQNLKEGLADYVTNHAWQAVTPSELWTSLESRPDLPTLPAKLSEIMENWITKPHYPLVNVKLEENTVVVTQEEFTVSGEGDGTLWYIPLSYARKSEEVPFSDTSTKIWLEPTGRQSLGIENDWIVFNIAQMGYYRVNYDANTLQRISQALSEGTVIPEVNKAHIIDDLMYLAKAGRKTYSEIFDFIGTTLDESFHVWRVFFNNFEYLWQRIGDENVRQALKDFVLTRLPSFDETVVDNATHIDTLAMVLYQKWLCKLGDEACLEDARQKFRSGTEPSPDLRSNVYCYGTTSDTITEDFRNLYLKYIAEGESRERQFLLKSMACPDYFETREHYLLLALNDENVRPEEVDLIFSSAYSIGPEGVTDVLDLIVAYHGTFKRKFGDNSKLISLLGLISTMVTTSEQYNKIDALTKVNSLDVDLEDAIVKALKAAEQSLEKAQALDIEFSQILNVELAEERASSAAQNYLSLLCGLLSLFAVRWF